MFPLRINAFLLYLQRNYNNGNLFMIIGREKEQRELMSLLETTKIQYTTKMLKRCNVIGVYTFLFFCYHAIL